MKNYLKKVTTLLTALTLVVVLGVCLSACGSSSLKELSKEDYKANLEAAKYEVRLAEGENAQAEFEMALQYGMAPEGFDVKTVEWAIEVQDKEDSHKTLQMAKFTTEDAAKAIESFYDDYVDEMFDNIPDSVTSEEISEAKKANKVKRAGTVVFYGHEDLIDAAYGK